MALQIYIFKPDNDTRKAERFFKERRVPYQLVTLGKHRLGERELQTFAAGRGAKALVADTAQARSHPICYTTDERVILQYLLECPQFLRTPIVRSGARVVVGVDENAWKALL